MNIIIDTSLWFIYNLCLALIGTSLGWLAFEIKNKPWKAFVAFLWLIFIPNTIYVLTDLRHLFEQWGTVASTLRGLLMLPYLLLELFGLLFFVLGLYPFDRFILGFKRLKLLRAPILVAVNFVIAFGVVIGRVQRTNSWEVFTNPARVYTDGIKMLTTPEFMLLTLLIGLLGNLLYFTLKQTVVNFTIRIAQKYFPFRNSSSLFLATSSS